MPRRAAQLRDGLRIKGLVEFTSPVPVLTDASQLRGAEVLIVAMKTPGTAEALEPLRNADIGAAFSIQNGMWKNEALANAFGPERVLGCLANTSGELLPSGEVLFTRNVNIYIGELPAGSSARSEGIARTIDASGVRATSVPDVLAREWTKFVGWAALMLMSITTRATTWRYLTDPDCALVMVRLVREVAGIAHAHQLGSRENGGAALEHRTAQPLINNAVEVEPDVEARDCSRQHQHQRRYCQHTPEGARPETASDAETEGHVLLRLRFSSRRCTQREY